MKLVIFPILAVVVLLGAAGMFSAARDIWRGVQASRWPKTIGHIQNVQSIDTSSRKTSSREIKVGYTYQVEGKEFAGTTIHPCYGSSSMEAAHQGLESTLRAGQKVQVYYDPSQPERSVLSAGFYSSSLAAFFACSIFFMIGLCFFATLWFALNGGQDFASGIQVIN